MHTDAYMILTYIDPFGERISIWNARDGAAPARISFIGGRPFKRVDEPGTMDRYLKPPIGSLVIIDCDYASVLAGARAALAGSWPNVGEHLLAMGIDAATRLVAHSHFEENGPMLAIVTAKLRNGFLAAEEDGEAVLPAPEAISRSAS